MPLLVMLQIGGAARGRAVLTRRNLILLTAFVAFVGYVAHSGGDELAYSTKAYIAMRETQAHVAAKAFGRAPVRRMFEGGMCMFAYYSRLPYLAEMSGLTQYSLAKQPLAARGYIGREKAADARWLTENRIQFVFSQAWPPVPRPEPRLVDEIYFGDTLKARI